MSYDPQKPMNDGFLAEFPPEMREQLRSIVQDAIVNAGFLKNLIPGNVQGNIPISNGTECKGLNAERLGGVLPGNFAAAGHDHNVATGSLNGFMAKADKTKLDSVQAGAEVNQNAFSNVQVGTTTIQADSKTDTLEFASGKNIAITPDATNDRVTIAVTGKVDSAASADTCTGNAATATNATNHISTTSGAHAASTISCTATGDVAATNVQAAIAELASKKVAAAGVTTSAVANKIVQRDSTGKIAGDITGSSASCTGNAASATKLQKAVTINGVGFDGTKNIVIGTGEPIGTISSWASLTIPDGYLECNGQAVSRTSFSELFAKIGTNFGTGDGKTTFNVPDFRGVVLRGLDKGRGLDIDGASRAIGSYQADELKSHSHTIKTSREGSGGSAGWNGCFWEGSTTGATGGTETRMKNVAVIYIVKAKNVSGSDTAVNNANAKTLGGFEASAFAMLNHKHDDVYEKIVAQQLGANGYTVWSSGRIDQWMIIPVISGFTTFTLPTKFGTPFYAFCCYKGPFGGQQTWVPNVVELTTTTVKIWNNYGPNWEVFCCAVGKVGV